MSAIFVLVVLSALGAFMVTIGETERATVTYAVQGARAFHAAQSGVEWGTFQALNTPLGTTCDLAPASVTTGPFLLSGPGLDGFQVTVVCNYSAHQEGPSVYQVFVITSTAVYGTYGNPDYFSRSVQATISSTNAP